MVIDSLAPLPQEPASSGREKDTHAAQARTDRRTRAAPYSLGGHGRTLAAASEEVAAGTQTLHAPPQTGNIQVAPERPQTPMLKWAYDDERWEQLLRQ